MSKKKLFGGLALAAVLAFAAMNPAAAADRKTTNTIIGAGIGAAAGAVMSQGDTLATLGGAAAGGLLGNILTEEPRKRRPAAHSASRHYRYVDHRHPPRHARGYHHAKWKGNKHHGKRHHHHR